MTMVRLRTLAECCRLADEEFKRLQVLYHRSCRVNGEVAKITVFYAQLCSNSVQRRLKWEEKLDRLR